MIIRKTENENSIWRILYGMKTRHLPHNHMAVEIGHYILITFTIISQSNSTLTVDSISQMCKAWGSDLLQLKIGFETEDICVLLIKFYFYNSDSHRSHWIYHSGSSFFLGMFRSKQLEMFHSNQLEMFHSNQLEMFHSNHLEMFHSISWKFTVPANREHYTSRWISDKVNSLKSISYYSYYRLATYANFIEYNICRSLQTLWSLRFWSHALLDLE